MSELELDQLTQQLQKTSVGSSGVSFAGKSLKLNSEEDAKEVVEAIKACKNLEYLNLEGNTLGIDAAKAIAKALEAHQELKRALWKDMFTGRMKTEIPKALQFLGSGLVLAGARLTELDLSDNAFGPIGVEGLVSLLRSPACYSLQTLKLNNNGLGITGGKMLSRGLLDCYKNSKEAGQPLALRVFIAGRNRLENDGATALAEVFKKIGSLEELSMPQNGIYHLGIKALCDGLVKNPNLQVLNLNDNTLTVKGAIAVARILPDLQQLKELNLGDCLLKTKGALLLADALSEGHAKLEELFLESNEIGASGGLALAKAMRNKTNLKKLILGANQFGEAGCQDLQSELTDSGRLDTLGTLSDDEEEDEDQEYDDGEEGGEEEESDGSYSENKNTTSSFNITPETPPVSVKDFVEAPTPEKLLSLGDKETHQLLVQEVKVSVNEFLEAPTPEKLLSLGDKRTQLLVQEVKKHLQEMCLEKAFSLLMKVSSICGSSQEQARQAAFLSCDALYQELFSWSKEQDMSSLVNNALMVHLGLIKSEDKKLQITWNLEGCMLGLGKAVQQEYFPQSTRDVLNQFLRRQVLDVETKRVLPSCHSEPCPPQASTLCGDSPVLPS